MKEFKLHRTDKKTFFEFRSNPESRCEGFTLTYCDDGTVVMSGDYGTLCWKRNYRYAEHDDFNSDYGFPNKDTGMGYFDEKVCQFGIKQEIEKFDVKEAIKLFEERYSDEDTKKYNEVFDQLEGLEEYDEIKFYELVGKLDCDLHEYNWKTYTSQFKFIFEALKSVSDQVWNAVKKAKVSPSQKTGSESRGKK